jgi:DNA gyrase/topoisomerase IV subunit B
VNNLNTHEGGTHFTHLKATLSRTINNYAAKSGALRRPTSLILVMTFARDVTHGLGHKSSTPQSLPGSAYCAGIVPGL